MKADVFPHSLSTTCDDNAPSPISIIEQLVSGDPDTDKVKQNSLGLCFKPFEKPGEDKDKLTWGEYFSPYISLLTHNDDAQVESIAAAMKIK